MNEETCAASVDLGLCRELARLEYEKTVLEERAKRIGKRIEQLWKRVYPMLLGRSSQPLENGVRLQPKRSLACNKRSGVDSRVAVAALKECGLDWLVSEGYESKKLKEYITGLDKEAQEHGEIPSDISDILPEKLRALFSIFERHSVVCYGVKPRAKAAVAAEEHRAAAVTERSHDGEGKGPATGGDESGAEPGSEAIG